MLDSRRRCPDIVPRGVYHLPFIGEHGETFLVAVSRSGRRIMEATVEPNQNVADAVAEMRSLLDLEDPLPLRLVR